MTSETFLSVIRLEAYEVYKEALVVMACILSKHEFTPYTLQDGRPGSHYEGRPLGRQPL